MKTGKLVIGAMVIVVLLSGCAELFELNLFAGLDPTPVPNAADFEARIASEGSTAVLTDLRDQLASPSVFNEMEVEERDALAGLLKGVWEDPAADTADKQNAQVLYADLQLRSTGGDKFVNGVTSVIPALASGEMFSGSGDATTEDEVQTLVTSLIPEDIAELPPAEQKDAVTEMLDGLIAANEAYAEFETSLAATDGVPPADSNMGEIAQGALVTYMVGSVSDVLYTEADADAGKTQGEVLYELL